MLAAYCNKRSSDSLRMMFWGLASKGGPILLRQRGRLVVHRFLIEQHSATQTHSNRGVGRTRCARFTSGHDFSASRINGRLQRPIRNQDARVRRTAPRTLKNGSRDADGAGRAMAGSKQPRPAITASTRIGSNIWRAFCVSSNFQGRLKMSVVLPPSSRTACRD